MPAVISQYVCPAQARFLGLPLPWICAGICKLIDGEILRCPECGLEREYIGPRKRSLT